MRIAFVDFVCDPAKPGLTGLSDLVWDMAKRLTQLGDEVHVVAPYTVDRMPDDAVRVHRFPLPPIAYRNILGHLLIVYVAYRRLLALDEVDIVHVPEYLSASVLGTVMANTPVVFTEPGNIYERIANGNPYDQVTSLVYRFAARRAAKACARLVATSAEMAEWWRWTGMDSKRICRVPLGIDTGVFHQLPDGKEQLGLPSDARVILYAARLSRENGADVALQAVARLRDDVGHLQLHILGDGPERPALEDLSRSLGIDKLVTWHGWVDFRLLPRFYSAADAFVFTGRSGGTPRVLLQAMACGAPVVASAIGGITDHVDHGKTGMLFRPGSSENCAAGLTRLLADDELRHQIGRAASQYARAEADWDVLVPRIRTEVYCPLVSSKGA